MTFREFFAARWGKWPSVGDPPPNGYDRWDAVLWETVADYLDAIVSAEPVTRGLLLADGARWAATNKECVKPDGENAA